MSVVINTNVAANQAATNLGNANAMLQKSLNRLSSGKRIVSPADDAGGLAVSMKMEASIKRADAANTNVANAVSFLQTQDGALDTAGQVLDRINELKTLSSDVTKSSDDVADYNKEFTALKAQLTSLSSEKFNGVDMFSSGATASTLAVGTSEDGTQTVNISKSTLANNVSSITAATDLASLATTDATGAITNVASSRAQNGAESSRLQYASTQLTNTSNNLAAANSRIADVDVAKESAQFAKYNVLVQAGTAMTAQANSSSQVALKLLNG